MAIQYVGFVLSVVAENLLWDVNQDGTVDASDLTFIEEHWGESNQAADVNNDGIVDIFDLVNISRHLNGFESSQRTPRVTDQPTATVFIDPPMQSVPVGGTTVITVKIKDVVDLYAFEFKLAFEATALKVKLRGNDSEWDFEYGDFLKKDGAGVFEMPPEVDEEAGLISKVTAVRLVSDGVDGVGILATITFDVSASSSLVLEEVKLSDSKGNPILANIEYGEIFNSGDVSGDGSVTAYDAALILQFVVGLINELPIQIVDAPTEGGRKERRKSEGKHDSKTESSVNEMNTVRVADHAARPGDIIRVPVLVDNINGLFAGGIALKYDSTLLKAIKATPDIALNGSYWKSNTERDGEIRFAFASDSALHLKDASYNAKGQSNLLIIEFEVLPNTEGKTIPLILGDVTFLNSVNITKINGSVTVIPSNCALFQNYPNPFNPETWLPYQLGNDAPVTISIYNAQGRLIRILHLGNQTAGVYITKDKAAHWDGKDSLGQFVTSGVYFYSITDFGEFTATRKMVIMK